MDASTPGSLSAKIRKGLYWTVGMRWSNKIISLVSITIMARLLTPEDYGLVALSLVIIGSIQIFFEIGVETSLLRDDKSTKDDFDTAWSLRLIQALSLCALLPILAPYAANYYQDDRLIEIFYLCSLSIFINGFENIGIIKFRKELNFNKDFIFNVVSKFLGTVATISLAFYYQSYHALLIGTIVQKIMNVVLSYSLIDYRPRFTLSRFNSVWAVSKWMLVKNFANYATRNGEYLIVGKLMPMASMGHYRWTQELNGMASQELLQPISRVLLPGLASIQADSKRLYNAYLKSLNFIVSIAIPVILGLGVIAAELIPVLLGGGDKWLPIVPLLEVAVFIGFFRALHSLANNLLIIVNKIKYTAYIDMIRTTWVLLMIYPAFQAFGIVGMLYVKVIASAFTVAFYYYLLIKYTKVTLTQLRRAIWRPCVSGLTMSFIVLNFAYFPDVHIFIILLLKISLAAFIYTFLMLLLWLISGKPDSFEKAALQKVMSFIKNQGNK